MVKRAFTNIVENLTKVISKKLKEQIPITK